MVKKTKIDRVEQLDIFNALPELSILIFSFLPVRSLMVLRSVCKWFLSIIDDPEFVKFHLRHFPSNALQNRLLFASYTNNKPYSYAAYLSSSTDEEFADLIYTTPKKEERGPSVILVDSIDGLLLLSSVCESDFLLWTPSMKKHRWMSPPEEFLEHVSIGYDRASDDYKVLVICAPHTAYVYSLKKGCWRAPAPGFDKHKLGGGYFRYNDNLSTNDGMLLIDMRSDYCTTIWFDWGTEAFRYGNQEPVDINIKKKYWGLMKLDGGSTAGMFGYGADDEPCIWALEISTMSWSKRYKVCPEMVPWHRDTISFIERDGELVLKQWRRNVTEELTCDVKTQMIKTHIQKQWAGYGDFVYVESMIIP